MCLSLARRYNTLDLAGKVSVPRDCGPFGNPGDEGRRRLGDGTAASRPGLRRGVQAVTACRGIVFSGGGYRDCVRGTGQRGAALSAKVVLGTTHYDTFCIPAESSKVPWARALRLWTPGRGCCPEPGSKTGNHASHGVASCFVRMIRGGAFWCQRYSAIRGWT